VDSEANIARAVRKQGFVRASGGRSKPALSRGATLDLRQLSGVLAYDPSEYTFTARAATPLSEVRDTLAEHGQELPFDPPLVEAGATLGGTVAAGLSGPGRFRYGGVRDFLLGVRFVDGRGEVLTGGGKVVKNAAGFDLPKLMVGSLGRFGVLTELTFKVFPAPEAALTVRAEFAALEPTLVALSELAGGPFELSCLEFEPPRRLWLRLRGSAAALPVRLDDVAALVARHGGETDVGLDDADVATWRALREFAWVPRGHGLVKVPIDPATITRLESTLAEFEGRAPRRYGVGGNVLWLAWPYDGGIERLEDWLGRHALAGLAVTGRWLWPVLGAWRGDGFAKRLAAVFDPNGRFRLAPDAAMMPPAPPAPAPEGDL
jgi:glycolate oxidase FAD binding subunit